MHLPLSPLEGTLIVGIVVQVEGRAKDSVREVKFKWKWSETKREVACVAASICVHQRKLRFSQGLRGLARITLGAWRAWGCTHGTPQAFLAQGTLVARPSSLSTHSAWRVACVGFHALHTAGIPSTRHAFRKAFMC